nr:threonine synthase [Petrotoga olearia]
MCISCGEKYEPLPTQYLCPKCGEKGILDVEYDYEKIKTDWNKQDLKANPDPSIWRYLPLLPIEPTTPKPTLRVGGTPLYKSKVMAKLLGIETLYLKDDGLNPTGSLKDRASAIAVVKAQEAGMNIVSCASTGNAASSLAGNIASMGNEMKAVIFVPSRAPIGKVTQLLIFGALVLSVKGSYEETFYLSQEAINKRGWYNRNAAINPYLVEGKKTSSIEIAEQLNWEMVDWLVYSVGDGCTIAGAWKGVYDLKQIGFIDKLPKLLGVQSEGCAPITEAFKKGTDLIPVPENTIADSIAVGKPRNYMKAIKAIKESNGDMINVSDQEILDMMKTLGKNTGIFGEPAGVAGIAGIKKAVENGIIKSSESVAVVITGNGLKDIKNAEKAVGAPLTLRPDLKELSQLLNDYNF